jgi:hypothetical protein
MKALQSIANTGSPAPNNTSSHPRRLESWSLNMSVIGIILITEDCEGGDLIGVKDLNAQQ